MHLSASRARTQAYDADIYTIMLGTNDAKVFNWFPCTGGVSNCSWVAGPSPPFSPL